MQMIALTEVVTKAGLTTIKPHVNDLSNLPGLIWSYRTTWTDKALSA